MIYYLTCLLTIHIGYTIFKDITTYRRCLVILSSRIYMIRYFLDSLVRYCIISSANSTINCFN